MKRSIGLAALLILTVCLIEGLALAQLGTVENRPGEAGAQEVFEKFGSNPWSGGDPWSQATSANSNPFTSLTSTSENEYQLIGVIDACQLSLCDGCGINSTCNRSMDLNATPGIYNVYAVTNGTKFVGIWLELATSAA